jgi:hypothetical protein
VKCDSDFLESRWNPRTIFQATINADAEVFASLDDLDIDYMPDARATARQDLEGHPQLLS